MHNRHRGSPLRQRAATFLAAALMLGACAAEPDAAQSAAEQSGDAEIAMRVLDGPNAFKFDVPRGERERSTLLGTLPDDGPVSGIAQAVVNGTVVANRVHGVVAIWGYALPSQEWRQICSAALFHNQVIITARHCFEDPAVGSPLYIATMDDQGAFILGGQFAPDDMDVALMVLDVPFSMYNATDGYRRPLFDAADRRNVTVLGYGWSALSPTPSSVCRTGTKGCEADPRPLRMSNHTTRWHPERANTRTELVVQTNASGQHPYNADSGAPVLRSEAFDDLGWRGLVGVTARVYAEGSTWFSVATPVQHFRGWACGLVGC